MKKLKMLALVVQKPDDDPLRKNIFKPRICIPKISDTRRDRGRPKLPWAAQIHNLALGMTGGSQQNLEKLVANMLDWGSYCK